MFVAGRQIKCNGKIYERGDVVPEAATWDQYIREAHKKCGQLLDLDKDQHAKLQAEIKNLHRMAKRQATSKVLQKIEAAHAALTADLEILQKQCEAKQEQMADLESQYIALAPAEDPKKGSNASAPDPGGGVAVTAPPPPTNRRPVTRKPDVR